MKRKNDLYTPSFLVEKWTEYYFTDSGQPRGFYNAHSKERQTEDRLHNAKFLKACLDMNYVEPECRERAKLTIKNLRAR